MTCYDCRVSEVATIELQSQTGLSITDQLTILFAHDTVPIFRVSNDSCLNKEEGGSFNTQ